MGKTYTITTITIPARLPEANIESSPVWNISFITNESYSDMGERAISSDEPNYYYYF